MIGYVVVLFGSLPFALPCWNGFLRDRIGQFVTIEQIHLLQYMGLGALAAGYVLASRQWVGALGGMALLLLGCGLLDEAVQGWLPQRIFQWSDVFLNWMGCLVGFVGGLAVSAWSRKFRFAKFTP